MAPGEVVATQYYGGAAIYCVTPTTRATVLAHVRGGFSAPPVNRWELAPPAEPAEDDDEGWKPGDAL